MTTSGSSRTLQNAAPGAAPPKCKPAPTSGLRPSGVDCPANSAQPVGRLPSLLGNLDCPANSAQPVGRLQECHKEQQCDVASSSTSMQQPQHSMHSTHQAGLVQHSAEPPSTLVERAGLPGECMRARNPRASSTGGQGLCPEASDGWAEACSQGADAGPSDPGLGASKLCIQQQQQQQGNLQGEHRHSRQAAGHPAGCGQSTQAAGHPSGCGRSMQAADHPAGCVQRMQVAGHLAGCGQSMQAAGHPAGCGQSSFQQWLASRTAHRRGCTRQEEHPPFSTAPATPTHSPAINTPALATHLPVQEEQVAAVSHRRGKALCSPDSRASGPTVLQAASHGHGNGRAVLPAVVRPAARCKGSPVSAPLQASTSVLQGSLAAWANTSGKLHGSGGPHGIAPGPIINDITGNRTSSGGNSRTAHKAGSWNGGGGDTAQHDSSASSSSRSQLAPVWQLPPCSQGVKLRACCSSSGSLLQGPKCRGHAAHGPPHSNFSPISDRRQLRAYSSNSGSSPVSACELDTRSRQPPPLICPPASLWPSCPNCLSTVPQAAFPRQAARQLPAWGTAAVGLADPAKPSSNNAGSSLYPASPPFLVALHPRQACLPPLCSPALGAPATGGPNSSSTGPGGSCHPPLLSSPAAKAQEGRQGLVRSIAGFKWITSKAWERDGVPIGVSGI